MTLKELKKQILCKYPKELVFNFVLTDYEMYVVGYPYLVAFITAKETDLWVHVSLEINLSKRQILFPDIENGKSFTTEVANGLINSKELSVIINNEQNFFDTIPLAYYDVVCIYSNSHWEILKAISQYDKLLIDLIMVNPVLAYILINIEKFNKSYSLYSDVSYIENLIKFKQKEILQIAFFGSSQRIVKIISKIEPKNITTDLLIKLRLLLNVNHENKEEIINYLSHVKTINHNLLLTIVKIPNILFYLSKNAIEELTISENFHELLSEIMNIKKLADRWGIKFKLTSLNKLESKKIEIKEKADELKESKNTFPLPPIDDSENIIAIRTVSELNSWSKRQSNCVRQYKEAIMKRQCYIYKVIHDFEEATLELKIKNNSIMKGDLLATKNKKPSEGLIKIVDNWLLQNGVNVNGR